MQRITTNTMYRALCHARVVTIKYATNHRRYIQKIQSGDTNKTKCAKRTTELGDAVLTKAPNGLLDYVNYVQKLKIL